MTIWLTKHIQYLFFSKLGILLLIALFLFLVVVATRQNPAHQDEKWISQGEYLVSRDIDIHTTCYRSEYYKSISCVYHP